LIINLTVCIYSILVPNVSVFRAPNVRSGQFTKRSFLSFGNIVLYVDYSNSVRLNWLTTSGKQLVRM